MKSEKDWVDQLYEVRCEPDKLLIMITNRRQQLKNADFAELEKPEQDAEELAGRIWATVENHGSKKAVMLIQQYAEAYHARMLQSVGNDK